MHKPWHSLVFGLVFFLGLAAISFFFPKDGVLVLERLRVRFPQLRSFFEVEHPKTNISQVLEAIDEADQKTLKASDAMNDKDTSFIIEGAPKPEPEIRKKEILAKLITGIQFKNPNALNSFFDALTELKNTGSGLVRVLHYGDSQIEGDRITDYLREKLQGEFGGEGPGLLSLMPLTSSIINKISVTANWDRYNISTSKDKRVEHKNFGVLAGFTRFTPYKKLHDTTRSASASVTITTTQNGGQTARAYKKVKLFYGGSKRKTWCEFYDGPALISADSLEAGGFFKVKEFNTGNGSYTHSFRFKGKDSPDFYGISLQSDNGVLVDNIALRGSSGTFFHQINQLQLKQFYAYMSVKLVILQFGGNSLPAIQSDTMAANYASYLRGQITILKKLAPSASILFIGPADMDVKEGTEYVTHPYLEITRDEIKKVVLESGCAFYDLYDIMGGRNSMSAWVEENLAATDYIHFSPRGARKVAALLHISLINEFNNYKKLK